MNTNHTNKLPEFPEGAAKIDFEQLGMSDVLSKLPPGEEHLGLPWDFNFEAVAEVINPATGETITGWIKRMVHVTAAFWQNPALIQAGYGKFKAGWPQMITHQPNGGVLVVPYTVVDGETWIGFTEKPRPLYIIDGKTPPLWDLPRQFVGVNNDPESAIYDRLRAINGLESAKFIWPFPKWNDRMILGTMQNEAFTLTINDKESDKAGPLFIVPDVLRPNGVGNHKVMDVQYNPVLPPTSDTSREANEKRKEIQFLQTVTRATFVPWWEFGLLGTGEIVLAQAFRVHSAVKVGLLPTK